MAIKSNPQDIDKLIELVGGKENVATVSHCITRLRFVLNDPKKKPNPPRLKNCRW